MVDLGLSAPGGGQQPPASPGSLLAQQLQAILSSAQSNPAHLTAGLVGQGIPPAPPPLLLPSARPPIRAPLGLPLGAQLGLPLGVTPAAQLSHVSAAALLQSELPPTAASASTSTAAMGSTAIAATGSTARPPASAASGNDGAGSGPSKETPHDSRAVAEEGKAGASRATASATETPRCHLHKKLHATCKICQRVAAAMQASSAAASGSIGQTKEASEESNKPVFTCSQMLKDQILKSSYFKSLLNITTLYALAEEIHNFADGIDIYQAGSATSPSIFICCAYRIFTMDPSEDDLLTIIDHLDSALVRCVGFAYIRFSVRPDRLWPMLEEYILDDMELRFPGSGKEDVLTTIGEYVESLLLKEKYFGIPLPRLPVAIRRKLEEHIAPAPQYRKRAQVNRRSMKLFREEGTAIEVNHDGKWHRAEVLEVNSSTPSRIKVRAQLEDMGELLIHIGRVVLRKSGPDSDSDADRSSRRRRTSRSRSRARRKRSSGSEDLSYWKGKSDAEMLKELRERAREEAVCGHGKDYARRPTGFEIGLAVRREQGNAESRLMQEDTFQESNRKSRRQTQEDVDEDRERQRRRAQDESERQRKLMQIYEKYGQSGSGQASGQGSSRPRDVEEPDVMRLG